MLSPIQLIQEACHDLNRRGIHTTIYNISGYLFENYEGENCLEAHIVHAYVKESYGTFQYDEQTQIVTII